ncbi:methyltransferase domain-containing protein [Roseiarcaceae bacterium H3SJ34-1]|uniref:class I SAM-dependent methyltransferase n=1 Tax=Terripilifer ovatus TaxID=3032367 RepID=UPI003AB91FD1|nr:methyltransferase domain-containing protein [Roseiarcaceae bacterium H3SJ34-1]
MTNALERCAAMNGSTKPKPSDVQTSGSAVPTVPVKDFFERQSQSYSAFFDASNRKGAVVLFKLRCDLAIELLSNEAPHTFLDLATGTGEITRAIVASLKLDELQLNDISPGMLDACRRQFADLPPTSKTEWTNEDAFELLDHAGKDRFDAVLCLGLIAHTGRLPELMGKIFASLRPGGTLILQSSLTDHPGAWITASYARSALRRTDYKVNAFSKDEIISTAKAAGFQLVDMRRFGVCLPFGDRILGRINYHIEEAFAKTLSNSGGDALFKLRKPL